MRPANFRDVGETLGLWRDPSPLPSGRLLRGGRLDPLSSLDDLGNPKTILNLRRGPDPDHLDVVRVHEPAPNSLENYDTHLQRVSDWVRRAVACLAADRTRWPVYVHCTAGRDRTGVVIAAVLLALDVPTDLIINEYLLSEGSNRTLIGRALAGLRRTGCLPARERAALRARLSAVG